MSANLINWTCDVFPFSTFALLPAGWKWNVIVSLPVFVISIIPVVISWHHLLPEPSEYIAFCDVDLIEPPFLILETM